MLYQIADFIGYVLLLWGLTKIVQIYLVWHFLLDLNIFFIKFSIK